MSQPLLARLAARGERISVAALPWVAPVYRAMPGEAAEVIELPFSHGRLDAAARWRLAGEMRGRGFDTAYVLPNSIKSALMPWLAGIPRRVGYRGEGRPLLLNRLLPNPTGRPQMVAFYSALAGAGTVHGSFRPATEGAPTGRFPAAAADPAAAERPRLWLPAERLRQACARAAVEAQGFWVLAPGAEYGPAKRWPAAHCAALAGTLHAERGWPVLLLGSAKERGLCGEIAAAAGPGTCRVLAGGLALDDAMALIAAARGVVSNDSGLMHVAAAFGVPQVAVFGSTSPEHTPPLNPHARVIWLKDELKTSFGLGCVPCFDRSCRYGHTRCLTEVAPSRVRVALHGAVAAAGGASLPAPGR